MIVVLTNQKDRHPQVVIEALQRMGASVFRFDTERYPQEVSITLKYGTAADGGELRCGDQVVRLDDVRAVWYRRPAPPQPHPGLSDVDTAFVSHEANHVLRALTRILADRFWVNPAMSSYIAEHKPYQLSVAAEVGLEVPKTLMTNDPDQALAFFRKCGGPVVYKSFRAHGRPHGGTAWGLFTTVVSEEQLRRHLAQIRVAPCIFQEYVHKDIEYRVTVIGTRFFVDEIRSQEREDSRIDWRRPYMNPPMHGAGGLPLEIQGLILQLLKRLNLVFGCIDLIRTPDGRIVFLEINPNGQWAFVEEYTGMPLTECFSQMLLQARPDYALPADSLAAGAQPGSSIGVA